MMVWEKRRVATRLGEIAYVDRGEGPVALFVHGVFLNSYFWRNVVAGLQGERRCIALDLLSHGDSPALPDQDISFRGQAAVLRAFCEALQLEQVDLVANDSGGAIAQIFAVRSPERLRTLTLTNCDVHDNYPPSALTATFDAAAAGAFSARRESLLADMTPFRTGLALGYEAIEKLSDETLATYLRPLLALPERTADLERWLKLSRDNSANTEIEPELRRLTVPTLIVWGTNDIFFPLQWAYWLKKTIPGAKRVVELEGARLFFPEERPEALISELRRHWREADGVKTDRVVSV